MTLNGIKLSDTFEEEVKRVERDREELRERMRVSAFFHDDTFYTKFGVVQSPLPSIYQK